MSSGGRHRVIDLFANLKFCPSATREGNLKRRTLVDDSPENPTAINPSPRAALSTEETKEQLHKQFRTKLCMEVRPDQKKEEETETIFEFAQSTDSSFDCVLRQHSEGTTLDK